MDRFVVREPRNGAEYPLGNQIIAFPANTVGSNMIPPETMYFSGPYASEFPIAQNILSAQHNLGPQDNINAQHNISAQHITGAQSNMDAQYNINAQQNMADHQNFGAHLNMSVQQNTCAQQNINAQHNMGANHNTSIQHTNMGSYQNLVAQRNFNAQQNTGAQQNIGLRHNSAQFNIVHNMNSPMAQSVGYKQMGQNSVSPGYLVGYTDNGAQPSVSGQQIQRNTPVPSFGSDYQNRSLCPIDRNKQKSFNPQASVGLSTSNMTSKPQPQQTLKFGRNNGNKENQPQTSTFVPQPKKPNELDLLRNDIQNQIMTRADKLKAIYKTGPRAFSGPVEKVLKWHKSLQDIGVLIFYEVVAKCVNVRAGEVGSKVLVVRDYSGPAMQVVYYEIDFLLPDLRPPCTIRVIGRMMAGTCRLQAFSVRLATGDDVATLPRRAAVAQHHVSKLCKEFGNNP